MQSKAFLRAIMDAPIIYPRYSWRAKTPNAALRYITDFNAQLSPSRSGPVGFDLEWRPNFRKGGRENPVALIQLAYPDIIYLVHISFMHRFPDDLRTILEDPDVLKAGVGIQDDCKKLFNDHGVSVRNCVDLSLLARSVDSQWKGPYVSPLGLSRLVRTYHQLELAKPKKIQMGNWEAPLSVAQQEYAANDAHAGLTLYNHLMDLARTTPATSPLLPEYYSFHLIRGVAFSPDGNLWKPQNPHYDPGPPPEPKPKVPKEDTIGVEQKIPSAPASSSTSTLLQPHAKQGGPIIQTRNASIMSTIGAQIPTGSRPPVPKFPNREWVNGPPRAGWKAPEARAASTTPLRPEAATGVWTPRVERPANQGSFSSQMLTRFPRTDAGEASHLSQHPRLNSIPPASTRQPRMGDERPRKKKRAADISFPVV